MTRAGRIARVLSLAVVLTASTLVGLAALNDSPAAQQAAANYEKDREAAKQDFRKKLQRLRQD